LRRAEIQLGKNLVFGDVSPADLFLAVLTVLVSDLARKLCLALLLGDLETSREAAPFFLHKLGDDLLAGLLNLELLLGPNLGVLALGIQRPHSQARERKTQLLIAH
jgi:hypothetical protein